MLYIARNKETNHFYENDTWSIGISATVFNPSWNTIKIFFSSLTLVYYSLRFLIDDAVDFFSHVWPFVLFKKIT